MRVYKNELFDAIGEVLYCFAISKGHIDIKDVNKIKELYYAHLWRDNVVWSFKYECRRKRKPDELLKRSIIY